MEEMLHYVWEHKIFPLRELLTTDGQVVEVINPGLHNTDSGPDFLNARITIAGISWVGNVEIHVKASDWHLHHHDSNPAYDNVILHVVASDDCAISSPDGTPIPQLLLPIPDFVRHNYDSLLASQASPRCKDVIRGIPLFFIHNWLSALQVERLEYRARQIDERLARCGNDWEHALFVTIARNFGFGINGDAFEAWAYSIPMTAIYKHRDNLFQIEAIFFGQAGLLDDRMIPEVYHPSIPTDTYLQQLRKEYQYLSHKFGLTPMNPVLWKFLRLRPQNFPHIRIAQLAMMWVEQTCSFSRLINASDISQLRESLQAHVSPYWKRHYTFASTESAETDKHLTDSSKDLVIINTVSPFLFAYGKYRNQENLCERAISLLETIRPEDNRYVREWQSAGVDCRNAADSQAIIHLAQHYCTPHDCLRCRFGYEFIRHTPDFLRENTPQLSHN